MGERGEMRTDALRRAQDRYLTDAEFHAVVCLAVRTAAPIASDAEEAATMAASIALVLAEGSASRLTDGYPYGCTGRLDCPSPKHIDGCYATPLFGSRDGSDG